MAWPQPPHRHLRRARARPLDGAGTARRSCLARLRRRRPGRRRDRADAAARRLGRGTPTTCSTASTGWSWPAAPTSTRRPTATSRHAMTSGTRPERDASRSRSRARRCERDMPVARHLPRDAAAERGARRHARAAPARRRRPRRTTGARSGSFDGADHDVRLAAGSLAARAAGEVDHATKSHHHQGDRARSARASSRPAGARSTSCPRRSRTRSGGSPSACSGTRRWTRRRASSRRWWRRRHVDPRQPPAAAP